MARNYLAQDHSRDESALGGTFFHCASLGGARLLLACAGRAEFFGCAALTLIIVAARGYGGFATRTRGDRFGSIRAVSPFRARAGHTRGVAARRRPELRV